MEINNQRICQLYVDDDWKDFNKSDSSKIIKQIDGGDNEKNRYYKSKLNGIYNNYYIDLLNNQMISFNTQQQQTINIRVISLNDLKKERHQRLWLEVENDGKSFVNTFNRFKTINGVTFDDIKKNTKYELLLNDNDIFGEKHNWCFKFKYYCGVGAKAPNRGVEPIDIRSNNE